jgi:hypothetical protein
MVVKFRNSSKTEEHWTLPDLSCPKLEDSQHTVLFM